MDNTPSGPKAAPESTLSAGQERTLWIVADLVFLAVLILLSALFQPEDPALGGTSWLVAPLLGWVVGHLVAFVVQPRKIRVPSYRLMAIGVVLVVIINLVAQGGLVEFGRALGGFVLGLFAGVLILRAHFAQQDWERGHQR